MKKVLSLLLTAAVLFSSVAAYAESFEERSSLWTVDSGSKKVEKPGVSEKESCVVLSGRNQRGVWRRINASGTVAFEAEVYYSGSALNVKVPEIKATDDKGVEAAVISVSIINGSLSAIYSDGSRDTRSSVPISKNEWHRITVEADTEKDVFSIWLNGETVLSGKKFSNNFNAKAFSSVSYYSASVNGEVYIDNLDMYLGSAKNVKQKTALSHEDILFDEDFNGVVSRWNVAPEITQVKKPDGEDENDKAMFIPPSLPNKYLSRNLGEIEEIVTVEAEVMVENTTRQIKIPDIYVNGNVQGVLLSVVNSNITVPYYDGQNNIRANTPVPLGAWFKVTIECNPLTDKFSIWINGNQFVKDVSFYNGVDAKTISFVRFNIANADDPGFYVDNVRAYKGAAVMGEAAREVSLSDHLAKAVVMKADSNIAYMTNYRTEMDVKPYVTDTAVMLPVDEVARAFYADSGLDVLSGTQYVSLHGDNMRMTENSSYFTKNEERIMVDVPPVIKDGIMYASLKTIDALIDRETYFHKETQLIFVAQRGHLPTGENLSMAISGVSDMYAEEPLPSAEVYVSIEADDEGDGSIESPYNTIEKAQAHVRRLLREGQTGDITVCIREGTYYLNRTLRFDNSDSHSGNYTVTYKSFEDELVIIDGGKRITGWKPYKNGIYTAEIPKGMNPHTLYEDGNRVTIARYPNEEYNRVIMAETAPKRNFIFKEGDIPVVSKPTELMLYIWPGGPGGHYNWSMARPKVTSLDYEKRHVALDRDLIYELGTGSRYFAYNALEFLDVAGEYYIDKDKSIMYYMPKNPDIENAVIVAPPTFDLISVSGSNNGFARNIVFEGLDVKSTDLSKSNFVITNAENILITKCRIYNSGHNGVYMQGSVRNSRVDNCHIYQMGFYGVFTEGRANTTEMINYGNSVTNCHIHNIGEMNGNAVGVRFSQSSYSYAANNKVNDSPRNGLHLLGTPDQNLIGRNIEGTVVTQENVRDYKVNEYNTIEYNDVSRCIQDSQDTNAIGAWGIDWFNVIRKNAVYDNYLPAITVHASSSFWFPYYFDENSNGSFIVSNLSYDNQIEEGGPMNAAVHINASKDAKIHNNIFADETYVRGVISVNDMDNGGRMSERVNIQRNIFHGFLDRIYSFSGWNKKTVEYIDFNLFKSRTDNYLLAGKVPENTLDEWTKSSETPSDKSSLISDPMFVSKEKNDYRLKYNSPAYILGFEDINQSDIGLKSDFAFSNPNDKLKKAFAYRQGDYHKKAWATLNVGETAKLFVDVRTENGYLADNSSLNIKYVTSDDKIARADDRGNITAVGKGSCIIGVIAQRDSVTVETEMEIVVGDSEIVGLNIMGIGKSIEVSDTIDLKVTAVTEFGKQIKLDNFTVTSNRDDAHIEYEKITLNGTGNYEITVTSNDNPNVFGRIELDVFSAAFKTIALTLDKQTYNEGETVGYSYKLIDSKGNEMDGNGAKLKVEGDEEGFVTVENNIPIAKQTGMGKMSLMVEYQGATVVASSRVAVIPKNLSMPEGFSIYNYSPESMERTAGYAYVDGGRVHMTTSGSDAWNAEDSVSLLAKQIEGNKKTTVTAIIHELTTPGSYLATGAKAIHAAAGVMIRDKDSADSNNVFVRYRLNGDVVMSYRTDEFRATTYQKGSAPSKPVEVKLEKDGNKFTGSYKNEAGEWVVIATIECTMGDNIYAGVGLQSGVSGDYNSAQFTDIQIIQ